MTVQYLYICMYYNMSFSKLNSGIRKKNEIRNQKRRWKLRAFRSDTFRHPVSMIETSGWRETAHLSICASFTCLRKLNPISGGTRYICLVRNCYQKRRKDGRKYGKSSCSSRYSGNRTSAQELRHKFRKISLTSAQINFGTSYQLRHT